MARADEVPPGDDPEAEEDLGRRGTMTKEFHLRPVDGKGLKPIPIRDGETKVVGRNARFGILDERVAAHHALWSDPAPDDDAPPAKRRKRHKNGKRSKKRQRPQQQRRRSTKAQSGTQDTGLSSLPSGGGRR